MKYFRFKSRHQAIDLQLEEANSPTHTKKYFDQYGNIFSYKYLTFKSRQQASDWQLGEANSPTHTATCLPSVSHNRQHRAPATPQPSLSNLNLDDD